MFKSIMYSIIFCLSCSPVLHSDTRHEPAESRGIQELDRALSSDEWKERERAADGIARIGADAKSAIPSLIMRLDDEEWRVRKAAANALAQMGPEAESAVPALTKALGDYEWQVRKPAAYALAAIGMAAKSAMPQLIAALGDEEWHVRKPAAYALAAMGKDAKPALQQLIRALGDEEWQVRKPAALALGAIGADAAEAIPALEKRLNDSEEQVQDAAMEALRCIDEDRKASNAGARVNQEKKQDRKVNQPAPSEISPRGETFASKIEFWDTQRKGANCFNVVPKEAWFQAARDAGIEWVRLAFGKWRGARRDFLMGDADRFTGIVQEDLAKLIEVLDWAHKYDLKIAVTPLDLPGNRWVQNNDGRRDLRLWNDKTFWDQAARFWRELADNLREHPAVYAYNILNEPIPEMKTGIDECGPAGRYEKWYRNYKGTAHDLPAFYETVIAAIREADSQTPIMLDGGWYARPDAFVYWPKIEDENVLYSFHMYEPYAYTSRFNFRDKKGFRYPGTIDYAGERIEWNRQRIEAYFSPFFEWASKREIPINRLVCGEFGCYRRNEGCGRYLADVIAELNSRGIHWAFYSFREDEWDGYDYELGSRGLGAAYWTAKEAGGNPQVPRHANPLFDVIEKEFVR